MCRLYVGFMKHCNKNCLKKNDLHQRFTGDLIFKMSYVFLWISFNFLMAFSGLLSILAVPEPITLEDLKVILNTIFHKCMGCPKTFPERFPPL